MSDIYGSHFEFGGKSSRIYGLIIANVNTNRITQLSGTKEGITVFSKSAKKRYLIDDDYTSSPISFDIEILTECGDIIIEQNRRQIEKWLFGYKSYRKFYLDEEDDEFGDTYEYVDGKKLRKYLNCRLINPEKIESSGKIIGYKATLEADSDMFWQDAVQKVYPLNSTSQDTVKIINVEVDTDLNDYIYPKVTLHIGEVGGDITVVNNDDDSTRATKFVNISPNSTIVMKGELNYLNEQYYEKFCYRNFIRLLDGENNLTITGNVKTIELEFSERRMM